MLHQARPLTCTRQQCLGANTRQQPRRQRRRMPVASMGGGGHSLYIGVDVGTQSTKCCVYEASSREVVGRGSVGYSLASHRPGQAEQHPATWIEASGCSACSPSHLPFQQGRQPADRLPRPRRHAGLHRLDPGCAGRGGRRRRQPGGGAGQGHRGVWAAARAGGAGCRRPRHPARCASWLAPGPPGRGRSWLTSMRSPTLPGLCCRLLQQSCGVIWRAPRRRRNCLGCTDPRWCPPSQARLEGAW